MDDEKNGSTEELVRKNRLFKKEILDVVFNMCDTFYVHCMPNPLLRIGKRGLTEKEKEQGVVLVFGPYSTRHLNWDDDCIFCEMRFERWEPTTIPFECIARVYDKEGHVVMQWAALVAAEEPEKKPKPKPKAKKEGDSNVIEVDFTRKRPPSE